MRKIKILFLIPHLGGGGAERVVAQLIRLLDPDRFDIHLALITADASGAEPPPWSVAVYRLNAPRVRSAWLKLIFLIWKLRPAIILCGMAHLNFLLLILKPFLPRDTHILLRQNTTASSALNTIHSRMLYRLLYPRAEIVICQSRAMASDLFHNFGVARHKLVVLHNPITRYSLPTIWAHEDTGAGTHWKPSSLPRLLAVGRLSPEKGIDLLLEALVAVRHRFPHLELQLLGEGPEQLRLQNLAAQLGLTDAVHFAGFSDPSDYYADATLYILPSRLEGMPNALLEAAAAGLPLVATPCCQGLCDLLEASHRTGNGVWLAPEISSSALAEAILTALTLLAPVETSSTPLRFEHDFLAPFEAPNAIAAYEALFAKVAKDGQPIDPKTNGPGNRPKKNAKVKAR